MGFVIVSVSERGFWSNDCGWVRDLESANVFDAADKGPLPTSQHKDSHWLERNCAPSFFFDDPLCAGDDVMWKEPEIQQSVACRVVVWMAFVVTAIRM